MFRWIKLAAVAALIGVALAAITWKRTPNPGVWYRLTHKRVPLAKLHFLLLVLLTVLSTISGAAWIATKVAPHDPQGRVFTLELPVGEIIGHFRGTLIVHTSIQAQPP